MEMSQRVRLIVGTVVSFVTLFGFLFNTRPSEDNFLLSFIPLVLLWVLVYFTIGLIFNLFFKNVRAVVVRMIRISTASTAAVMVMFGALGQLSFIDGVGLLALVLLGAFYFSRTWHS